MTSSLHRLPPAVLGRIFVEYTRGSDGVVLPSPLFDSPLCISLVSKEWRTVSLATPGLWTLYTLRGDLEWLEPVATQLRSMVHRAELGALISISAPRWYQMGFFFSIIQDHPAEISTVFLTEMIPMDDTDWASDCTVVFTFRFEGKTSCTPWRELNRLVLRSNVQRSPDWPVEFLKQNSFSPHLTELNTANLWLGNGAFAQALRNCPELRICSMCIDVDQYELDREFRKTVLFEHHYLQRLSLGFSLFYFNALNVATPNLTDLSIGVVVEADLDGEIPQDYYDYLHRRRQDPERFHRDLMEFILRSRFPLVSLALHFDISFSKTYLCDIVDALPSLQELTLRWHPAPGHFSHPVFGDALDYITYRPQFDALPLLHTLRIDLTAQSLEAVMSRCKPRGRLRTPPGALTYRTYLRKVTLYVDSSSLVPHSKQVENMKAAGVEVRIEDMEPFGRDTSLVIV